MKNINKHIRKIEMPSYITINIIQYSPYQFNQIFRLLYSTNFFLILKGFHNFREMIYKKQNISYKLRWIVDSSGIQDERFFLFGTLQMGVSQSLS